MSTIQGVGNPWRKWLGFDEVVSVATELHRSPAETAFSIDAGSVEEAAGIQVPSALMGGTTETAVAPVAKVSRRLALQVPAIRRALDLVGVLGTLPLETVKSDLTIATGSWLEQPERDVPREVTMTRLVHDLALDGIAWWKVVGFDWKGYPAEVVRLDPNTVDVMPDYRVRVTTSGHRGQSFEWPADSELIRFEMPGNGWLVDGARAIRQCLLLDAAAQRYADGAPPGDYFTPREGAEPVDLDDEDDRAYVQSVLDAWHAARKARSTGFVPDAWEYHKNDFDPQKLELADQRQHAVLEISRVTGIDAEELGVSTTSRTYSNQFDRRKQYTDFTLGTYRGAIEGRLRMGDVSPRGTHSRFALGGFMRSDDLSRYQAYRAGLDVGAIGQDEIRAAEGKPPLPAADKPVTEPAADPAFRNGVAEPPAEPAEREETNA